jgi:hypothetical protein
MVSSREPRFTVKLAFATLRIRLPRNSVNEAIVVGCSGQSHILSYGGAQPR